MQFDSLLQRVLEFGADKLSIGRGEILFRQGDPGDDMFLVLSGRLRVVRDLGGGAERVVGEVGRGEPVGETAVLGECERGATVIAIRRTELVRISAEAFQFLRNESPGDLVDLIRITALRLKRSYESGSPDPLPSCIAVVPTNGAAPLDEYCARFVEVLRVSGRDCVHLRSSDLPAELAGGQGDGHALAGWLNEQEASAETVVLQPDGELTDWSRRCLRQADLVLLLGQVGSDPTPGPLEAALEGASEPVARPRIDLILLQESEPYVGTEAWLAPRSVHRHYHVRPDSLEDRARLRRLLVGEDTNLVLGGGGARGLTHIGALRAFEELGLPIDRVGGTSIGAVIGAWVARGADWRTIAEEVRAHFVDGGSMRSLTLPAISIDTGKRYIGALEKMFGDAQIEDLPINYFCVSCNLSRARVIAHRSGLLADWVGASISVPGVAPPYVLGGDLLVDGGVLNNLPLDIAGRDGSGRLIGVDVSSDIDLTLPPDYNGRPGAWEVLRSWLPTSGGDKKLPGMLAVLSRVSMLSSTSNVERSRHQADLLIRMPVNGFKMFDWECIDELIELGYQTALDHLRPFLDGGSSGE